MPGPQNHLTCPQCQETKTAKACGNNVDLKLDFDKSVPRIYFNNGVDDPRNCTLRLDGTESFEAEAWCNPYADDPLYCEDPNAPSTLHYDYVDGYCVNPE